MDLLPNVLSVVRDTDADFPGVGRSSRRVNRQESSSSSSSSSSQGAKGVAESF